MQYALLIYETPADFARREASNDATHFGAWRAYYKAVVEAGVYAGVKPLDAPETATTVRRRDGKRIVQDGPFASSKEQLGGFMLLELPSLDAALEWAARCPAASYGAVEIRPVDSELQRRFESEDQRR
jgi:hypothetical protein